jgi:hypothetical protein
LIFLQPEWARPPKPEDSVGPLEPTPADPARPQQPASEENRKKPDPPVVGGGTIAAAAAAGKPVEQKPIPSGGLLIVTSVAKPAGTSQFVGKDPSAGKEPDTQLECTEDENNFVEDTRSCSKVSLYLYIS